MLDCVYGNCPVITAKGTWMGDIADKYNIGISLQSYEPEKVLGAIKEIMSSYDSYYQNTIDASAVLKKEHHAENTISALSSLWLNI